MTILELAEQRAKAEAVVRNLGAANAYGRTPEEQVAASAQYRIAQDALAEADRQYRNALNGMSADDLLKAANT